MLNGQPISLERPARRYSREPRRLPPRQGVGELEALVARAETVRFGLLGFEIIGRLMDNESRVPQRTISIYWTATLHGVVDQVRTAFAELMGELAENTPPYMTPTTDQVDRAVHVATGDPAAPQAHVGL